MALSYIGGKSKIGKWIVPFFPNNIETYVEPFSGMFWVFFNMDLSQFPRLTRVVYNDFNPLNYNLFQCLQNPTQLLNEVNSISCQQMGEEVTPEIYREQFVSFQAEIFAENINIKPYDYTIAAKYAYVISQVFSGSKPETSSFIDLKGKYKSKYLTFRDKLTKPNWIEHFIKISDVENMDFQKVIEKYDSPSTYLYLDPPYWKTENYYNNHDFNREDHERLSNILNNIQGKFSLSYYDFEVLHQWYPKDRFRWEEKEFAKAAAAKKGVKQNMAKELLILNY